MRYQGRITEWKDSRGFGFITQNGGGDTVFVHIRAFGKGQQRPVGNELVTYELVNDEKKGSRAESVLYVGSRPAPARIELPRFLIPVIFAIIVAGIGFYGWQHFTLITTQVEHLVGSEPVLPHGATEGSGSTLPLSPTESSQLSATAKFECQGKRYCSEMTSCEEATFYLKNCPGVEIDGDGDGIPCESQWCGH
ncbi:cold-shock protein [Sulfuricella sp. T08]|uniref:excalibur calcium-binding domain-containing protein n=1 Tax=Sulfuricella sp. T08 TaxID=1632857 RepID=UPI000617990B|nr:excalibur calcium-binding domain-containing protein [Sulfuricella sp. T08]GAO37259.1 cold-shock protein [Sulfuricella sp. T08]